MPARACNALRVVVDENGEPIGLQISEETPEDNVLIRRGSKRGDIINRFQNSTNPRVLVMQPQATAHGITLTAADTVVFYGPLMSVEQYTQAIARADRKGQTSNNVTVVHIQGSPMEKKMFDAMDLKVTDHALLTQMFDMELKGA